MHLDAPYISILLCLMPDDFTYQVESAATQWVNLIYLCTTEISKLACGKIINIKILFPIFLYLIDSKQYFQYHMISFCVILLIPSFT